MTFSALKPTCTLKAVSPGFNEIKVEKIPIRTKLSSYLGNHFACSDHGSSCCFQYCSPPLQ